MRANTLKAMLWEKWTVGEGRAGPDTPTPTSRRCIHMEARMSMRMQASMNLYGFYSARTERWLTMGSYVWTCMWGWGYLERKTTSNNTSTEKNCCTGLIFVVVTTFYKRRRKLEVCEENSIDMIVDWMREDTRIENVEANTKRITNTNTSDARRNGGCCCHGNIVVMVMLLPWRYCRHGE
jgi:hypothetical protein